jgi:hypothetical protein
VTVTCAFTPVQYACAVESCCKLTAAIFCLQTACEYGFSASQQSLLSSVVFGGMVLGAAAWGLAADALGRRTVLLASCSVVVAAGLASAAAPGYAVRCALLASPSNFQITCCLAADRQANSAAGVMQRCSCGRSGKRCCPWLCGGLEHKNLAAPLLSL